MTIARHVRLAFEFVECHCLSLTLLAWRTTRYLTVGQHHMQLFNPGAQDLGLSDSIVGFQQLPSSFYLICTASISQFHFQTLISLAFLYPMLPAPHVTLLPTSAPRLRKMLSCNHSPSPPLPPSCRPTFSVTINESPRCPFALAESSSE
jgi:hypothetical protein